MKRSGGDSSPNTPLTADEVIALLQLQPLPVEGGYYRETYRSADRLPASVLARFGRDKAAATAIYYLLTPDTFSALHRLPTDEIYHFYLGDPVSLVQLAADGTGRVIMLGHDICAGQFVQTVVPAGVWQGSHLCDGGAWALLGTTMAPGFDFSDFEAAERARLQEQYPEHRASIERLTHS